jgi:hypothetical protein
MLHHRCAEMQDQASATDGDDFRFLLAIVRAFPTVWL